MRLKLRQPLTICLILRTAAFDLAAFSVVMAIVGHQRFALICLVVAILAGLLALLVAR